MSKTGSANSYSFCNFIYDHLLRRHPDFLLDLARAVDFALVKAALKDFCVDWGREPWEPVPMFKMVLLQFLYDLSYRQHLTLSQGVKISPFRNSSRSFRLKLSL